VTERRRGLGRGLGALIPAGPVTGADRPVDVFFPHSDPSVRAGGPSTAGGGGAEGGVAGAGEPTPASHVASSGRGGGAARDGALLAPADNGATDHGVNVQGATDRGVNVHGVNVHGVNVHGVNVHGATHHRATLHGATLHGATGRGGLGGDDLGGDDLRGDQPDDGGELDGLVPIPGAHFAEVPVEAIQPNVRQPRQVFDADDLAELVASIREVGILQPVVVRPIEASAGQRGYELIMGERRWRAAQAAGLVRVPAIVRETSDGDMLRDALLENLHRAQLNPLEEAAAYQQLLDDFACTHDELASRLARSRPQISNTIRLLKLPPTVQRRLAAGALSAGHARALLGLRDASAMEDLAGRVVARGLSVRATEDLVAQALRPRSSPVRRATAVDDGRLHERASWLSDRLEARVQISLGQRKGRIAIEFATVEDLDRILAALEADENRERPSAEAATVGV
jgi:ParB family chromosome partitioning protein